MKTIASQRSVGLAFSWLAVLFLLFDSAGKLLQVQPVIDGTLQLGYPRDSVFSLGAVLYRAATGKSPFGDKDTMAILSALATQTPVPPHRIVPSLPRMRHHPELCLDSMPLTPAFLRAQDCVLIVTDHANFDYYVVLAHARLVVDTRNATAGCAGRARVVKA